MVSGVPPGRGRRAWRQRVAGEIAEDHGGVASRQLLLAAGLSKHDIRTEVDRGVWQKAGRHTLCVEGASPEGVGRLWWAVWECGPRAVLDGASALLVAGLENWEEPVVWVSVPHNARPRPIAGVAVRKHRDIGACLRSGLPRTKPALAVIRAARWAKSPRAAATILAMTVQQRLVRDEDVMSTWQSLPRRRWPTILSSPSHDFIDQVIADVCDGAHALGELDFAVLCRQRDLPVPTRQAVQQTPQGRIYLDVVWEEYGVRAEINGAQHYQGLHVIKDALRSNEAAIVGDVSLQIPVLGLRLDPDPFMAQVERALSAARARSAQRGPR